MKHTEIFDICWGLQKEGKAPTVALIKSRLSAPTPLPLIIAGLKQWRTNPGIKSDTQPPSASGPDTTPPTLEQRVEQLESLVKALQDELTQLKSDD